MSQEKQPEFHRKYAQSNVRSSLDDVISDQPTLTKSSAQDSVKYYEQNRKAKSTQEPLSLKNFRTKAYELRDLLDYDTGPEQSADFNKQLEECLEFIADYKQTHTGRDLKTSLWFYSCGEVYKASIRTAPSFSKAEEIRKNAWTELDGLKPLCPRIISSVNTDISRTEIKIGIDMAHAWAENNPVECAGLLDELETMITDIGIEHAKDIWNLNTPYLHVRLMGYACRLSPTNRVDFFQLHEKGAARALLAPRSPHHSNLRNYIKSSWKKAVADFYSSEAYPDYILKACESLKSEETDQAATALLDLRKTCPHLQNTPTVRFLVEQCKSTSLKDHFNQTDYVQNVAQASTNSPDEMVVAPNYSNASLPQLRRPVSHHDTESATGTVVTSVVAISDFTSDDNSYCSTMAAIGFSEAVQSELMNTPDLTLVDRTAIESATEEIELNTFGFADTGSNLRIGKWVKADFLVTGYFIRVTNSTDRILRLEILDLKHADVLADATIDVTGSALAPLMLSRTDITNAVSFLQAALPVAQDRFDHAHDQVVLAPLFFRNAGKMHNLDFIEDDMIANLAKKAETAGIRMLRFPMARQSLPEAQLVVSGLVADDSDACQSIADVYVWGEFRVEELNGVPFADLPLSIDIKLWDGSDDLTEISRTCIMSELAGNLEELAKTILQKTAARSSSATQGTLRKTIADKLFHQAKEQGLEKTSYLWSNVSQETKDKRMRALQFLETACFFAPENREAQRQRIIRKWPHSQTRFWPLWMECRDWHQYIDMFGSDTVDATRYHSTAHTAFQLFRGNAVPLGVPADIPEDVRAEWYADIERLYFESAMVQKQNRKPEYIKDGASIFAPYANITLQVGLAWIRNPELRVKLCEEYYPLAVWENARQGTNISDTIRSSVLRAYTDAGIPDRGKKLIRQAESQRVEPSKKPTDPPQANILVCTRVNVLPPLLPVQQKAVPLDTIEHVYGIRAMIFHKARLWFSVLAGHNSSSSSSGSLNDYLLSERDSDFVYVFNPASENVSPLKAGTPGPCRVMAFCSQDQYLWMALADNGIWRFDPESQQLRQFEAREGMLTRQMYAIASTQDGFIFAGGGEPNRGILNAYDVNAAKFMAFTIGAWHKRSRSKQSAPGRIIHITPWKMWLLLDTQSGYQSSQILLYNRHENRWTNLTERVGGGEIIASTADKNGVWIGTDEGLHHFNPATDNLTSKIWAHGARNTAHIAMLPRLRHRMREVLSLVKPTTRLTGAVTTLLNDGDFLWIATTTDFQIFRPSDTEGDFVFLLHKPSGKWVGCFRVPGRIRALSASDKTLWIGMENPPQNIMNKETGARLSHSYEHEQNECDVLISIDKVSAMSISPDKWVSDDIPDIEFQMKISELPQRDQAIYMFLSGNYTKVIELLDDSTGNLNIEELFILGWSHDKYGLKKPVKAREYFQEILNRDVNRRWKEIARYSLKHLVP